MPNKIAKCTKAPFESKKAASLEIKMQRAQQIHFRKKYSSSKKNNAKTYCYECPRCSKWHLTTRKQKGNIKREAKNGKELQWARD